MKNTFLILIVLSTFTLYGQDKVVEPDIEYLHKLTRTVIDSSIVRKGGKLPKSIEHFGPNNTGVDIIRPGGRTNYPAFWIRDYSMSLDAGLIDNKLQKDLLLLTAKFQADKAFFTGSGSFVPIGSIPDHIAMKETKPIYFPGTLDDYKNQGGPIWRLPPFGDQFYFIHMAYKYIKASNDTTILKVKVNGKSLIERLNLAFNAAPTAQDSELIEVSEYFPGTDFGFRDVITMTGKLLFGSVLKYRAATEMGELYQLLGLDNKQKDYLSKAKQLQKSIPLTFMDERGMLRASTGKSSQPDVWGTAFAVYTGALSKEYALRTSEFMNKAYKSGTMTNSGYVRHVLTTDDFNDKTAWEYSLAPINRYQNGAYWATPVGWVSFTLSLTDKKAAKQLAVEFIETLKESDFRQGIKYGGPYECIFPEENFYQNPVYMTSVTCPYAAFIRMGY